MPTKKSKNGAQISIYLSSALADELVAEATRLERPISYVIRMAWHMSKQKIKDIPDSATLTARKERSNG
jgi:hypothetical protein